VKSKLYFLKLPLKVASILILWIVFFLLVCNKFKINKFDSLFKIIPKEIILITGFVLVAIGAVCYVLSLKEVGIIAASGFPRKLKIKGPYKYVRNPLYGSLILVILGFGMIINSTGIILGILTWIFICLLQCKEEEAQLKSVFKQEYIRYLQSTPMIIPNFKLLLQDFINKIKIK